MAYLSQDHEMLFDAHVRAFEAFGSMDFKVGSGIQSDGEELDAILTQLELVSRLAGVESTVDGVSLAINNAQQLEADVRRSRRYGFGAKLVHSPQADRGRTRRLRPNATRVQLGSLIAARSGRRSA